MWKPIVISPPSFSANAGEPLQNPRCRRSHACARPTARSPRENPGRIRLRICATEVSPPTSRDDRPRIARQASIKWSLRPQEWKRNEPNSCAESRGRRHDEPAKTVDIQHAGGALADVNAVDRPTRDGARNAARVLPPRRSTIPPPPGQNGGSATRLSRNSSPQNFSPVVTGRGRPHVPRHPKKTAESAAARLRPLSSSRICRSHNSISGWVSNDATGGRLSRVRPARHWAAMSASASVSAETRLPTACRGSCSAECRQSGPDPDRTIRDVPDWTRCRRHSNVPVLGDVFDCTADRRRDAVRVEIVSAVKGRPHRLR